jgi:hypothetical protein
VPLTSATLAAEGRVLILFPPLPLEASTAYEIVLREEAVLADLTGQSLVVPASRVLGTFTTAATPPNAPRVLTSFPKSGTTNQAAIGEVVVVFTRKVQESTVDSDSFEVTVDGDPPPRRSRSAHDRRRPARVLVAHRRRGREHGAAAARGDGRGRALGARPRDPRRGRQPARADDDRVRHRELRRAGLRAITSDPDDAIGIDQISGPANLAVEVELLGAQDGDKLVLTLFGQTIPSGEPPQLSALHRQVDLVPPFDTFTMTAEEIDLLSTSSPVTGRFVDGPVAFAFQLRRGTTITPLRLLDVDPDVDGVQGPVLDTHAPTLVALGTSGTSQTTVRSDVRDITLVGQASEILRRAAVTTALGDNALTPERSRRSSGARRPASSSPRRCAAACSRRPTCRSTSR